MKESKKHVHTDECFKAEVVEKRVRRGDNADMGDTEAEEVIARFTAIATGKEKGAFMLLSQMDRDKDGADIGSTLYSNGISPQTIRRCFEEAMKDNVDSPFGTSIEDFLQALRKN